MPFPRSLVQPFRKNMLNVGSGYRAYFAPFNIALASAFTSSVLGPTNLDLSQGPFTTTSLLTLGFADLGWIKDFKKTPESKIGQVRSGYRGAVRAQYRGQVGESFEVKFREYGRLQYKLASGANTINILAGATPTTAGPLSASGAVAVAMASYDPVAGALTVGSTSGFNLGDYIVCDIDYNPATYGIIGDAGTPVFQNAVTDVDYIRKNSDYVARVVSKTATQLFLDQPFIGGGSGNPTGFIVPQAGSKIQKIKGWSAREGGTAISEWSAALVLDTVDVAQVVLYYPHVSIMQNRDLTTQWAIENIGTTDLGGYEMDAQFNALAYDDPLDGETVTGYTAFYPRPGQNASY